MEKESIRLVRQILQSRSFLSQSLEQKKTILNQILETEEITKEELSTIINDEANKLKKKEEKEKTRILVSNLERLDYNTFITIILTGNIRGKHLLALCSGSNKLNSYCNREFQLLDKDGNPVGPLQNEYLFRLLLNRMNVKIPFNKTPREA
jgi:hypothetical protein